MYANEFQLRRRYTFRHIIGYEMLDAAQLVCKLRSAAPDRMGECRHL
jgi:hypothetical protein